MSVDSQLRKWQKSVESSRALDVILSGLTSKQRDYIQRKLRPDLDKLARAVKGGYQAARTWLEALEELRERREKFLKSQD